MFFDIWLSDLKGKLKRVAIDGKTIRGSKNGETKATHIVTAFASDLQLVLGQLATDEKSNEISAIPNLLEMFCLKGAIVTIDAMGTQTEIAKKIVEKGADYILALKGNQPALHDDVKLYFKNFHQGCDFETLEKGHGRVEKRAYFLETQIGWLEQKHSWQGLNAIGAVRSRVETRGSVREETRYYITTLDNAEAFAGAVRGHWAIENSLHWVLDVVFREDHCRARLQNAAHTLDIFRKFALQLMKRDTSTSLSLRSKRLKCSYDFSYALSLLRFP